MSTFSLLIDLFFHVAYKPSSIIFKISSYEIVDSSDIFQIISEDVFQTG